MLVIHRKKENNFTLFFGFGWVHLGIDIRLFLYSAQGIDEANTAQ